MDSAGPVARAICGHKLANVLSILVHTGSSTSTGMYENELLMCCAAPDACVVAQHLRFIAAGRYEV